MKGIRYVTDLADRPAVALTMTDGGFHFEASVGAVRFEGQGPTVRGAIEQLVKKVQSVPRWAEKGRPSNRYRAAAALKSYL